MLYDVLDKKTADVFLSEGERGHFRLTAPIRFSDKDPKSIEIEVMSEGEWSHPMAKDGIFRVTAARISNWVDKFNAFIIGKELPLDFEHVHSSRETPGWITKLYSKVMPGGKTSLFANLNITDKSVLTKMKEGSLKYISAEVDEQYEDKATGIVHDLIRGAALTNYPYLKNLSPVSLNFEEVIKHETDGSYCFTTLGRRDEGMKDKDFIIDLDADLGILSAEDIKLAEERGIEFAMPDSKEKVKIPKVKLPKELKGTSDEAKAAFFAAFASSYARSKDLAKATTFAIKKGKAMDKTNLEDNNIDGVITKLQEGITSIFAGFKKKADEKIPAVNKTDVKLEELGKEVVQLREFKLDSQKLEDQRIADSFKTMTPAAKNIFLAMLSHGRTQTVKFDDADISGRALIMKFTEEMKAAPTVNMFEQKSSTKVVKNSDDLNTKALAYQKEHKCNFRVALEEVSKAD